MLLLLLLEQERLLMAYVRLQPTVSKSFPNSFSSDIGEAKPLEVSNIMCLSGCKHSGSNTNITSGKFVRTTSLGLHMIEVVTFSVPVMDAVDSGLVNFEYFPNLLF
jgi:hypothetical protein